MSSEPKNVKEAVENLEELADHSDEVRMGDVLDEFGKRSFGPFLLMLGLLEVTPIGGIPGVPTLIALLCALIGLQLVIRQDHIWVPAFVEKRALASDKLMKSAKKMESWADRLDHWFHGRLKRFTSPFWQRIVGGVVILMAVTVPPLEFIPFASSAPMLTIAALGLALMVRDGLLMLGALVASMLALGIGTWLYWNSSSESGSFLPF